MMDIGHIITIIFFSLLLLVYNVCTVQWKKYPLEHLYVHNSWYWACGNSALLPQNKK